MGIFKFVKRSVAELAISRPPETKNLVIYKHPDPTIPMNAQLTVDQDDVAIFFRDGKVEGLLKPGRHTIVSDNIPFLSNLVDSFTDGNMLKTEVYFVTLREIPNLKFGGRIGSVEDPKSGLPVATMVHGSYSLRVVDPQRLLLGLVGMSADNNDALVAWFRDLLLKVMRDRIAELLVVKKWPLLDVTSGAYHDEIEKEVLAKIKEEWGDYGVKILRLGTFNISIDQTDRDNLTKLYSDAAYLRMTGGISGYQQLASAKAMMGAGEGLAKGGGSGGGDALIGGASLGIGVQMAGMMYQPSAPPTSRPRNESAPPPPSASVDDPFAVPPPPMFHFYLDGKPRGPYGVEILEKGAASGRLTKETLIWCQGMNNWTPAGEVESLKHLFSGVATSPPPFPA